MPYLLSERQNTECLLMTMWWWPSMVVPCVVATWGCLGAPWLHHDVLYPFWSQQRVTSCWVSLTNKHIQYMWTYHDEFAKQNTFHTYMQNHMHWLRPSGGRSYVQSSMLRGQIKRQATALYRYLSADKQQATLMLAGQHPTVSTSISGAPGVNEPISQLPSLRAVSQENPRESSWRNQHLGSKFPGRSMSLAYCALSWNNVPKCIAWDQRNAIQTLMVMYINWYKWSKDKVDGFPCFPYLPYQQWSFGEAVSMASQWEVWGITPSCYDVRTADGSTSQGSTSPCESWQGNGKVWWLMKVHLQKSPATPATCGLNFLVKRSQFPGILFAGALFASEHSELMTLLYTESKGWI